MRTSSQKMKHISVSKMNFDTEINRDIVVRDVEHWLCSFTSQNLKTADSVCTHTYDEQEFNIGFTI